MKVFLLSILILSFQAQSALLGRVDYEWNNGGYEYYYDTILDITWFPNQLYISTDASEWAGLLDLRGVDNWRLPSVEEFRNLYQVYNIRANAPSVFSTHPTCYGLAHLQNCLPQGGLFHTNIFEELSDSSGDPYRDYVKYTFQTDSTFVGGSRFASWAVTEGDPLNTAISEPSALAIMLLPLFWLFKLNRFSLRTWGRG